MKYKIFLIYKFISEYSTHTYPYSATMLLSIIIILILHTFISFIGAGNSNSLQYSCLEKPMDKGVWWATVHGIAKSQTRLNDWHTHRQRKFWRHSFVYIPLFLILKHKALYCYFILSYYITFNLFQLLSLLQLMLYYVNKI